MEREEIYISDYFRYLDQKRFTTRDWKQVNLIRDRINHFEFEGDAYEWLYNRRLNAVNCAEDERLFGIPRNNLVTPCLHGNPRNRWYQHYSEDYREGQFDEDERSQKDYFKRDFRGNIKRDRRGRAKEYGRVGQGLLNAYDNISSKGKNTIDTVMKIVKFVVMHPIASAVIVLSPFVIAILTWIIVYVVGIVNSIGHTPFVLCGDDEIYGSATVNLDVDTSQMTTVEYAAQVFIYYCDQAGWKSNATIGALSYILQEGGGFGTFTYEAYWSVSGPGGGSYDTTLSNEDWLRWLEESGKYQLHDLYYHNSSGSGNYCFNEDNRKYVAIGIGLLQDSDVWYYNPVWVPDPTSDDLDAGYWIEEPYKTTSNATALIEFANEMGMSWQDPMTQMQWIMKRFETSSAFDGDNADPTRDNRNAEEWCRRVCCGIGMPAWRYNTTDEDQNRYINEHTAHINEARELYQRLHGVTLDVTSLSGVLKDQCEGLKSVYSGGNATIADAAVTLTCADTTVGEAEIPFDQHGSDSPNLNRTELAMYKVVHETIFPGDIYFASCDMSVATAIRWSGADDTFPGRDVAAQYSYLTRRSQSKWDLIGVWGQVMLQPGDVIICNVNGHRHVKLYVGQTAAQVRNPESTATYYQGSFEHCFPKLSADAPEYTDQTYYVFRCTNPDNSDKYRNASTGVIND